MNGEISVDQVVDMFISAMKLGNLTWRSPRIDMLLEPASSGHLRSCSFCCVGFIFSCHLQLDILLLLV